MEAGEDTDHLSLSLCWLLTAQLAMEEARQGMMSAINVGRLIVTSEEFRRELVEALGRSSAHG